MQVASQVDVVREVRGTNSSGGGNAAFASSFKIGFGWRRGKGLPSGGVLVSRTLSLFFAAFGLGAVLSAMLITALVILNAAPGDALGLMASLPKLWRIWLPWTLCGGIAGLFACAIFTWKDR